MEAQAARDLQEMFRSFVGSPEYWQARRAREAREAEVAAMTPAQLEQLHAQIDSEVASVMDNGVRINPMLRQMYGGERSQMPAPPEDPPSAAVPRPRYWLWEPPAPAPAHDEEGAPEIQDGSDTDEPDD